MCRELGINPVRGLLKKAAGHLKEYGPNVLQENLPSLLSIFIPNEGNAGIDPHRGCRYIRYPWGMGGLHCHPYYCCANAAIGVFRRTRPKTLLRL